MAVVSSHVAVNGRLQQTLHGSRRREGGQMATSTQAPEPRRAEAKSSSYPEARKAAFWSRRLHRKDDHRASCTSSRSHALFDLDVSIEKMITGLRIIKSRSQAEGTVRVNCENPGNRQRLRGQGWQGSVTSNTAQRIGYGCARCTNSVSWCLVVGGTNSSVERYTKKDEKN